MDINKNQKFAVSRRRKSGGKSFYTKRRFRGNQYTKMITLSNELNKFVSASF